MEGNETESGTSKSASTIPETDAIPLAASLEATSIASARAFTIRKPCSKDSAPPKTKAEYSPIKRQGAGGGHEGSGSSGRRWGGETRSRSSDPTAAIPQ